MSFGAGPGGGGMDEYQRLMAERNAAAKKKRMLFGLVAVVAVAGGYFFWSKGSGQEEAGAGDPGRWRPSWRWPTRPTWASSGAACSAPTPTSACSRAATRSSSAIESAYFTQKATYSEHLTTDCVPKLEGARSSISGIEKDMLPALKPPYDKYVASLPKMQAGIESYAEKLKSRGSVKDVDQSIQEVGGSFSTDVTPESVAFEKFLVCAIPGLDKMKDIQGVLEFLAETCKKDPVPFMTKVRADCGALVQNLDKDAKPRRRRRSRPTRRSSTRSSSASCRRGSGAARSRARARRCSTSRRS
jgi:hypothetical protein